MQAFKARWVQLGGKIATEETYQSLGGNPASWQNTVTRLNGEDADVIVTVTAAAFGAQVPIVNGLRTLGNNTPVLNSWAGDGNYWYTQEPKVTNYYYVTYASAFGNDPVKAVNALAKRNAAAIAKAGSTGAFVTGPAAIDGILLALKRTGGNDQRRCARRPDGEVQERADHLGSRELLEAAALRVRTPVPGDPRPEQHTDRSSGR